MSTLTAVKERPAVTLTVDQAKAAGYAIVSRSGRLAARLDRPDWRQAMHDKRYKPDADFYRRCISKDCVIVPESWLKKLPNSGIGPMEFKNKGRCMNTANPVPDATLDPT